MSEVTSAGRATPSSKPNDPPAPSPRQHPPRRAAEQRALGERFAERLERESGRGSFETTMRDAAGRQQREEASRDRGDGERERGEGAPGGALLALQQAEAATGQQVSAERYGQLDRATIDRIAAQIAEARPGSAGAEAQVHFAAGSAAQMAHLRMRADGSIAIRVSGLDPRLTALQQGQLRFALVDALRRRDFRVDELRFEEAKSQRGRDDAMSRVV